MLVGYKGDKPVSYGSCPQPQSFEATAFGVTFIFGSYPAIATSRARGVKAALNASRQSEHGP